MTQSKTVVIMNGPPSCGKDTAAKYLSEVHGFIHLEMKAPLRKIAHAIVAMHSDFTIPRDVIKFCDYVELDTERKSTMKSECFGRKPNGDCRTWREFLIHISENVCKPIFDPFVFARAALKSIHESKSQKIVFSDGGFQEEVDFISSDPSVSLHVVHLFRDGCTFKGDSRSYVEHENVIACTNNAELSDLYRKLDALVGSIE